jgi:hypothetical protein
MSRPQTRFVGSTRVIEWPKAVTRNVRGSEGPITNVTASPKGVAFPLEVPAGQTRFILLNQCWEKDRTLNPSLFLYFTFGLCFRAGIPRVFLHFAKCV